VVATQADIHSQSISKPAARLRPAANPRYHRAAATRATHRRQTWSFFHRPLPIVAPIVAKTTRK
jgi:hypothetical protein